MIAKIANETEDMRWIQIRFSIIFRVEEVLAVCLEFYVFHSGFFFVS